MKRTKLETLVGAKIVKVEIEYDRKVWVKIHLDSGEVLQVEEESLFDYIGMFFDTDEARVRADRELEEE